MMLRSTSSCGGQEANGFTIRHFWGEEMKGRLGHDLCGAPDLMPIWTILDVTPETAETDGCPKLNY
jgi:hypothetical protein